MVCSFTECVLPLSGFEINRLAENLFLDISFLLLARISAIRRVSCSTRFIDVEGRAECT